METDRPATLPNPQPLREVVREVGEGALILRLVVVVAVVDVEQPQGVVVVAVVVGVVEDVAEDVNVTHLDHFPKAYRPAQGLYALFPGETA